MKKKSISKAQLEKLYYKDGLTQAEIAALFDCDPSTIGHRMQEYGLSARVSQDYSRIELPCNELYQLYVKQGLTAEEIAAHYNCSTATVLGQLKTWHIPVHLPGPLRPQRVPPEAYTAWTPELAWAVGLFASDGNLPQGKNINQVTLASVELELVEQFMGCIQLDIEVDPYCYPTSGNQKPIYLLCFSDIQFRAFLERIGLTPRKSLTIGPLDIPDQVIPDFVRGAWDGDGCWENNRQKRKSGQVYEQLNTCLVSGSPVYLQWIEAKIRQFTGLVGHIYDKRMYYHGSHAIALGRWLYYAPDLPASSRKRAIWEQFANRAFTTSKEAS